MNRRHSCGGFTLLELVVAMTLLALLLSAIMPALQQGLSGLAIGGERSRAQLLARSLLAASSTDLGDTAMDLPGDGSQGEFQWRVTREPYLEDALGALDGELALRPMRVTATVSWSDGRREVVLSTLSLDRLEEER